MILILEGRNSISETYIFEGSTSRETISGDPKLLKGKIKNASILITGAGGSIGSELCKQLLKLSPKLIVLYELSELKLYNISQELKDLSTQNIKLVTVLGNACELKLLEKIFLENKIDVVSCSCL